MKCVGFLPVTLNSHRPFYGVTTKSQAECNDKGEIGRLTILDSPEQILEVKASLVLAERFICGHLHHRPEYTRGHINTNTHAQAHTLN